MSDEKHLAHYGILRKSGRYPWGSGEDPFQRSLGFQAYYEELKAKGMTEAAIAKALDLNSTTELRAALSITSNQIRAANISQALTLKAKDWSNTAIANRMGVNESTVRSWLKQSSQENSDKLRNTAEMLKGNVEKNRYVDIGPGVSTMVGVSPTRLKTAVALLKEEEGYQVFYLKVEQVGNPGKFTNTQVLAPKDANFGELMKDISQVRTINNYAEDNGKNFPEILPPKDVKSKRVAVRYSDDGGSDKDGVIELRRGVDDISLGNAKYAQVRISVDGTHYLKGMAMYSDNLPDGVDMVFNTNKSKADAEAAVREGKASDIKHAVMKPLKVGTDGVVDAANPFGATVRQKHYIDSKGKQQLSPLNIVNEEGAWRDWSKTLSSQMLSKQSPILAKQQLDLTYDIKKQEFDDIMALTNPVIKKKLLEGFADGVESSSVHLKAAGLPRNSNHVILPINSLKDNEIYAPQYRNGEKVVLIRHPHGGRFEIPELVVNNRNREANSVIKQSVDAVGINSNVAKLLSGADFDGDSVLVIPNNNDGKTKVQISAPLLGLKDFDPQQQYPGYEGMKPMTGKQKKMGDVSNLITDMTIKGAPPNEIARAVRHSMVVIDAEKHNLNYKQSFIDNGIADLKERYQGRADAGASTLISRSKSKEYVNDRKARPAQDGGPIDLKTGEKIYVPTGETRTITKVNKRTGEVTVIEKPKTIESKAMLETRDANTLSSGQPIEKVYADYANNLKSLTNAARKEAVNIKPPLQSKSAKKVYEKEVASLTAKLNTALKNKPLERQAQILANAQIKARLKDNPHLDRDDIKKIKTQALSSARIRTGANKQVIVITPPEWDAIQSGAVSASRLRAILDNMDSDTMKQLATPRDAPAMTPAKLSRARSLLASGYTQAEVADALGVSISTLNAAIR